MMIVPLSVPVSFQPAFEGVALMEGDEFALLQSSLSNAPMSGGSAAVVQAIGSGESNLSDPESDLLLGALVAFINMARLHGWSVEEVVGRLAQSPDLTLEQDQRGRLESRIAGLIVLKPVRMVAKLMTLSWDHERVFTDVRFMTDLRPIFADDDVAAAEGAMIVQMLRLEYARSDGNRETISVALDSLDMMYLKKAIERAEAKEQSVRSMLADGGIDYVGVSE